MVAKKTGKNNQGPDLWDTGDFLQNILGLETTVYEDIAEFSSKKSQPNGNSSKSTKAQHGYEITDTWTNTICKTGVSGCSLNLNGTSPRANQQANKWNNEPGNEGRYTTEVVHKVPQGEGARQKILKWERSNAEKHRSTLDIMRHKRP